MNRQNRLIWAISRYQHAKVVCTMPPGLCYADTLHAQSHWTECPCCMMSCVHSFSSSWEGCFVVDITSCENCILAKHFHSTITHVSPQMTRDWKLRDSRLKFKGLESCASSGAHTCVKRHMHTARNMDRVAVRWRWYWNYKTEKFWAYLYLDLAKLPV